MMKRMRISRPLLFFYLQVSLGYCLVWLIADSSDATGFTWPRLANNIWFAFYIALVNIFFFEHILPVLRQGRGLVLRIFYWLFSAIGLLLVLSLGIYSWRMLGIGLHIYTPLIIFESVAKGIIYITPHGLLSLPFYAFFKYRYNHQQLKIEAQQLQLEKREAELNYLRAQTNPHFLFNTLNNIYVLARDKSELAPESILRLSELMRFMLYETGGAFIAIGQEIRIITEYLQLEKLRYDESLRVSFNYDIEDMKQAITPLLLVPLVENAFKHGVSETKDHPFADIHLAVHSRLLHFRVCNSMDNTEAESSVREHIGLANLRRQLELQYHDYDLTVRQDTMQFTADLRINLASHV